MKSITFFFVLILSQAAFAGENERIKNMLQDRTFICEKGSFYTEVEGPLGTKGKVESAEISFDFNTDVLMVAEVRQKVSSPLGKFDMRGTHRFATMAESGNLFIRLVDWRKEKHPIDNRIQINIEKEIFIRLNSRQQVVQISLSNIKYLEGNSRPEKPKDLICYIRPH